MGMEFKLDRIVPMSRFKPDNVLVVKISPPSSYLNYNEKCKVIIFIIKRMRTSSGKHNLSVGVKLKRTHAPSKMGGGFLNGCDFFFHQSPESTKYLEVKLTHWFKESISRTPSLRSY